MQTRRYITMTVDKGGDSWELETIMKDKQKMVTMMHKHNKLNLLLVYSYHGPLKL